LHRLFTSIWMSIIHNWRDIYYVNTTILFECYDIHTMLRHSHNVNVVTFIFTANVIALTSFLMQYDIHIKVNARRFILMWNVIALTIISCIKIIISYQTHSYLNSLNQLIIFVKILCSHFLSPQISYPNSIIITIIITITK